MPPPELEARAQRAGEERLAACQEVLYGEESGVGSDVESPAIAPFCGCDTCIVREVLDAAWPFLLGLAREEVAGYQPCHWGAGRGRVE